MVCIDNCSLTLSVRVNVRLFPKPRRLRAVTGMSFFVAMISGGMEPLPQPQRVSAVLRSEHIPLTESSPDFRFPRLPPPSRQDLASSATFRVLSGRVDPNSGGIGALYDDRVPRIADEPGANFFFHTGTSGGRVLVDFGEVYPIQSINTYSWHTGSRAPQVYSLFAADGLAAEFQIEPPLDGTPAAYGWQRLGDVDTRPRHGSAGGQHVSSTGKTEGQLGKFRYLLFEVKHTDPQDRFSNTFFSEIDVLRMGEEPKPIVDRSRSDGILRYDTADGRNRFSLDMRQSPELEEWAKTKLVPVIQEWYPKICVLLHTDGFTPPVEFSIVFDADMEGVAHARGSRIFCAVDWFRRNRDGEAVGAVVHELVHVVQNYGMARHIKPNVATTPGWVVEGIADYVRWFVFEPEKRGAEISPRRASQVNYDGNYRISANFLNWVVREVQTDMVQILNTAARQGAYSPEIWVQHTGHALEALNIRWKEFLQKGNSSE
jgi:hypothetical protein